MADLDYDAELFELLHRGTPGDVGFYRALCEGAGSVLELGVGYGRIMAALESVPIRYGLDRHPGLLARARQEVEGAHWLEADMRDFDAGRTFDRVIVPHSGMYCATSADDLQKIVDCAAKHLAPGGKFAFDAYDSDAFHEEARPEDLDSDHLEPVVELESDGRRWQVFEKSNWDRDGQRMEVSYIYRSGDDEKVGRIEQRYVLSTQWEEHLSKAGLRVTEKFGGFDNEPWDLWSSHRVIIAEHA